jgi:hypothetical protein
MEVFSTSRAVMTATTTVSRDPLTGWRMTAQYSTVQYSSDWRMTAQ